MILVCPTSFKGTLGASQAALAMAAGLRGDEVMVLPLSDGGPGLLDALAAVESPQIARIEVSGPLGAPVVARLARLGTTAVLESADACGLHLVPAARRDPLTTSTRGVGELLGSHLARSADPIVIGLGGSATVDGGVGMAQALGWRFVDSAGAELKAGGGELNRLARIHPPREAPALPTVIALADVDAPLLGPRGAAFFFAPQKGADARSVRALEAALSRLAGRIERDVGPALAELPGAGAGGGLGAGCVAFLGARLESGSDWVLERVGFDAALRRARAIVTGEGSFDDQSLMGKVTGQVIRRAGARGVPVLLVCGRIRAALPAHVIGWEGRSGSTLGKADLREAVAAALPALLSGRSGA